MAIINGDIDRVLVSEQKIDGIVRRIAAEIDDDYRMMKRSSYFSEYLKALLYLWES